MSRRAIEGSRPPARRQPAAAAGLPTATIRASVSDLAAFKDCARRYAYRSVYRLPVPASPQRWYGTLVHTVLQALAALRQSGAGAGPDEAARLWAEAWEASRGPKGAHAELRSLGESQLRRYAASPGWRDAEPLMVEQPFTLGVGAGDVTGRFDRIDAGPGGVQVVIDYKTGPPARGGVAAQGPPGPRPAVALAREQHSDEATVELHWLQTAEVSRMTFNSVALGRFHFQVESTARELAEARRTHDFPPGRAAGAAVTASSGRCATRGGSSACGRGGGGIYRLARPGPRGASTTAPSVYPTSFSRPPHHVDPGQRAAGPVGLIHQEGQTVGRGLADRDHPVSRAGEGLSGDVGGAVTGRGRAGAEINDPPGVRVEEEEEPVRRSRDTHPSAYLDAYLVIPQDHRPSPPPHWPWP